MKLKVFKKLFESWNKSVNEADPAQAPFAPPSDHMRARRVVQPPSPQKEPEQPAVADEQPPEQPPADIGPRCFSSKLVGKVEFQHMVGILTDLGYVQASYDVLKPAEACPVELYEAIKNFQMDAFPKDKSQHDGIIGPSTVRALKGSLSIGSAAAFVKASKNMAQDASRATSQKSGPTTTRETDPETTSKPTDQNPRISKKLKEKYQNNLISGLKELIDTIATHFSIPPGLTPTKVEKLQTELGIESDGILGDNTVTALIYFYKALKSIKTATTMNESIRKTIKEKMILKLSLLKEATDHPFIAQYIKSHEFAKRLQSTRKQLLLKNPKIPKLENEVFGIKSQKIKTSPTLGLSPKAEAEKQDIFAQLTPEMIDKIINKPLIAMAQNQLSENQKIINEGYTPQRAPMCKGKRDNKCVSRISNFSMNSEKAAFIVKSALESGLPIHLIMAIYQKESSGRPSIYNNFRFELHVFHKKTKLEHFPELPWHLGSAWKGPQKPPTKRLGIHPDDLRDLAKDKKALLNLTTGVGPQAKRDLAKLNPQGSPGRAWRQKLYASNIKLTSVDYYHRANLRPGRPAPEHIARAYELNLVAAVKSTSFGNGQVMGVNLLTNKRRANINNPSDVQEARDICVLYGIELDKNNKIIGFEDEVKDVNKVSSEAFITWNKVNPSSAAEFIKNGNIGYYGKNYNGAASYGNKLMNVFDQMVRLWPVEKLKQLLQRYSAQT